MTWRRPRTLAIVLAVSLAACAPEEQRLAPDDAAPLRIRFNQAPGAASYGTVDVEGLGAGTLRRLREADLPAEAWSDFFALYTADSTAADPAMPPVMGTYSVEPPVVRFTPRFPFVAGLSYRVRFDAAALHARWPLAARHTLDTLFTVPPRAALAPTVVTGIYPSADTLPMNQLKLYLHFSAPMAAGHAYANIQLIDEQTRTPVEAPFVEMDPELWDPQQRRFTLLFDPGRIKRAVGPNRERGGALQTGRSYRLVVSRRWVDAAGQPLQNDFIKAFTVAGADRAQPNPGEWRLDAPPAHTTAPVVLTFPEPLDHALLQRLLTVHDADGVRLVGTVATARQETEWSFTPAAPWQAGAYSVHVETILEDLAGNTLRSLFDVDLADAPPSEVREAEAVRVLPFVVKPPGSSP